MQLEFAAESLKLALRYNPEHRAAADLLEKVQGLLGERPDKIRTFYEWANQERQVKIQQRMLELHNLIKEGQALYAKKEFAEAVEKFEAALQIIEWMPYGVDVSREKKTARDGLRRAQSKN